MIAWWLTAAFAVASFGKFSEPDSPYQAATVDARNSSDSWPDDNLTVRGACAKLGRDTHACFDTDLLRLALVWRGGFLSEDGIAPHSYRNPRDKARPGQEDVPKPLGHIVTATGIHPGVVTHGQPILDPREPGPDPRDAGRGPLARAHGRWLGHTITGNTVTFSYDAFGARVDEQLTAVPGGITRTIETRSLRQPLRMVLTAVPQGARIIHASDDRVLLERTDRNLRITIETSPSSARLQLEDGRHVTLVLQPEPRRTRVQVSVREAAKAEAWTPTPATPWVAFERGGPPHWPQPVFTPVDGNVQSGAQLIIDDLTLPEPNPWRRRVRLSGIDFLPDGRAVVCTIDGDVWIVSDLDRPQMRWRRFTTGLHEPQSVVVRQGQILVFTRNGIEHIVDLNDDGEADAHRMFFNGAAQTAETREFAMDMVLQPDGSLVIAKGGTRVGAPAKHSGQIIRVAPDGLSFKTIATGLREPYLGGHPRTGQITATDQQGNWVPATPVHVVQPGTYLGFRAEGDRGPFADVSEPAVWIPHHIAASGAGLVWAGGHKLGPYRNRWLALDYNRGALVQVFLDGDQGAIHRLPVTFPSALLKAQVRKRDGMLYAVGFQLWGSQAQRLSGLFRVRHTPAGAPVPVHVGAYDRGVMLRLSQPLPNNEGASAARFHVLRWNYRRTADYGSGFYTLRDEPGQEPVRILGTRVSRDRRSVFLVLDDMQRAHQMQLSYQLTDARGDAFSDEVYLTVKHLRSSAHLTRQFGNLDIDAASAPLVAMTAEDIPVTPQAGRAIAERLGCISCHSIDGAIEGHNGPTWKGLFGTMRTMADGGTMVADDAYLRESIFDPALRILAAYANRDVGMPSYVGIVQENHVKALIEYIRSLQ